MLQIYAPYLPPPTRLSPILVCVCAVQVLYHPEHYKMSLCKMRNQCTRKQILCAFSHRPEDR